MTHEVTKCGDCPLLLTIDEGYYCEHPFKKQGTWIREDKEDGSPITPSDCPLFVEPLVLSIKKD